MAYDNFLIDKRVVERNIAKGLVDREQLKQQIDGLPDREANLVHVSLEGGASEDADLRADDIDEDDDDDEGGEDDDTIEANIPEDREGAGLP